VLLGVTPELAVLGTKLTAVDGSARMIEKVWLGDDKRRRAICADWLALPSATATVDAVVGDGSLNAIAGNLPALLREIRRVLVPRGVGAFRTFCAPEFPVEYGWQGNFHALKWRIAMALAANAAEWTIAVEEVRLAFNTMFPDRLSLCDTTGWSGAEVATIDYYDGAGHSIGFSPVSRLREIAMQVFSSVQIISARGYPLAERVSHDCHVIAQKL
jgi:SAM-dependent methyltransferase